MSILIVSCCLLALCSAAPTDPPPPTVPADNIKVNITNGFFKENFVIYTGQHDIVNILAPSNNNNIRGREPDVELKTVFFVEADINNGKRTDRGLYVYKDRKATKLIDNGRDAVATNENVVYIGASDGIYKYNQDSNSVSKHGTINDDIIQMAHETVPNTVYYLNANHEVFKLNADATTAVKISGANDVQAFVVGYEGCLYYYDSENNFYVLNKEINGIPKKVEGLPSKKDKVTLIALEGPREGAALIVDKGAYSIDPYATARKALVRLDLELPTAYAPQPGMIQFYARDKKLYEFNLFHVLSGNDHNELKNAITTIANTRLFSKSVL